MCIHYCLRLLRRFFLLAVRQVAVRERARLLQVTPGHDVEWAGCPTWALLTMSRTLGMATRLNKSRMHRGCSLQPTIDMLATSNDYASAQVFSIRISKFFYRQWPELAFVVEYMRTACIYLYYYRLSSLKPWLHLFLGITSNTIFALSRDTSIRVCAAHLC